MKAGVSETADVVKDPKVEKSWPTNSGDKHTLKGYKCSIDIQNQDWYSDASKSVELTGSVFIGKMHANVRDAYESGGMRGNCPPEGESEESGESVEELDGIEVCFAHDMHTSTHRPVATAGSTESSSAIGDWSATVNLGAQAIQPDGRETLDEELVSLSDADPELRKHLRAIEVRMLREVFERLK